MPCSRSDRPAPATSTPDRDVAEQLRLIFDELRQLRDLLQDRRKPTLTVAEFAELVGRDAYTVRTWIKGGRVHATRVQGTGPKGRLLIDRSELDRILAEGRGEHVPPVSLMIF